MSKPKNKSIIWEIFSPLFGLLRSFSSQRKAEQVSARETIIGSGLCGKAVLEPSRNLGGGSETKIRKYITYDYERLKFRVKVQGVHVGRYLTLTSAVTARNRYCKEFGIIIKKGE